jgi:hypothetical protein
MITTCCNETQQFGRPKTTKNKPKEISRVSYIGTLYYDE